MLATIGNFLTKGFLVFCVIFTLGFFLFQASRAAAPSVEVWQTEISTTKTATPNIYTATPSTTPTLPPSTPIPGITPLKWGEVSQPGWISAPLGVTPYNGVLATSPQKLTCLNGKATFNVGQWDSIYVVSEQASALFVRMPLEKGKDVKVSCTPSSVIDFYVYGSTP